MLRRTPRSLAPSTTSSLGHFRIFLGIRELPRPEIRQSLQGRVEWLAQPQPTRRFATGVQENAQDETNLKQLGSDIQAGHRQCINDVRELISQARIIGQWPEVAKTRVGHSRWTCWGEDNCHLNHRMAQKGRMVARHYDPLIALFNTEDEWTLTEFFALPAEMEAEAGCEKKGIEPASTGLFCSPDGTSNPLPAGSRHPNCDPLGAAGHGFAHGRNNFAKSLSSNRPSSRLSSRPLDHDWCGPKD